MLHNDTLTSNYVVFGIHPIWIFTCNLYRLFSGTKLTMFNSVPTDHSKHEAISDYFFYQRFGTNVEVLHPLDQPFSTRSGGFVLQNLSFTQTQTNFKEVLQY